MRAWWVAGWLGAGCSFTPGSGDDAVDARTADSDPSARVTDNLIGLWLFDETTGTSVGESSGVAPPVTMTIADGASIAWRGGSLDVSNAVDINSGFGTVNRLVAPCEASDEVTLEAWVTPASATQTGTAGQPARIATMTSKNISTHQIAIGQLGGTWSGQVRTSAATDAHGGPILQNGVVSTSATHLVLTSTATARTLYVDGVAVADALGGTLDSWETRRTFAIAGDPGRRNTWLGTIHLVAMYDRALDATDVMTNYRAGP
jgi:hypothetical protein